MSIEASKPARRTWLAPEVVQTSSMDCGPAALKCLLEGHGIPVSYGRLREACQTDVDGTSIDTIEEVAGQLGLLAEQAMIPVDHLHLKATSIFPALVVVRHTDGPTHFVVVWRRLGPWLQVMDPAIGRRWVRESDFLDEVYRHETTVPAADWREWAGSEAFLEALREQIAELGAGVPEAEALITAAREDKSWRALGTLDAATRLAHLLIASKAIERGQGASRLVAALCQKVQAAEVDPFALLPKEYWSVLPDPADAESLVLRGAVILRIKGRQAASHVQTEMLSPELAAALAEKPVDPLRMLWSLLKVDGLFGPLVLLGAIAIATGATVLEALLFRGLLDVGGVLSLPSQRLTAALALIAFVGLLLAFRIPVISESLRMGRRLEIRLRMLLLRKLPHLTDRYFQSRPISDMADRSHSVHLARLVPALGIHFVQTLFELVLTFIGIVLINPASLLPALVLTAFAIAVPALMQPMVNERDLRVRNHAGALSGFYLDTLLGLTPVRTHRAERAVSHQHEAMLVEWARSSRRLIRASITASGIQAVGCLSLASYLLMAHFQRGGGVTGADLLLIFWTLKLPAIGGTLTGLAQQYPMQRNVLLRLLEPLTAPEALPRRHVAAEAHAIPLARPSSMPKARGARLDLTEASVLVSGHTILRDVSLSIAPGEHVAIVGLSGAGKSSLIGVLLGWHRLSSGEARVDGEDLSPARLATLRHEIAWLDPAIHIWNRSFLDNLNYASLHPDFGETADAIEPADLRGVLRKLPDGLQTALGEGGALLSGGEGQRVRLGRALVQSDVRLALLDEPFRGMDRTQRVQLLAEARQRWQEITLLCVTHDVSETLAFGRVLVIEDGRIVEDGNPAQLATSLSRYRDLLEAERHVRENIWTSREWRHVMLQNGRVVGEAE